MKLKPRPARIIVERSFLSHKVKFYRRCRYMVRITGINHPVGPEIDVEILREKMRDGVDTNADKWVGCGISLKMVDVDPMLDALQEAREEFVEKAFSEWGIHVEMEKT